MQNVAAFQFVAVLACNFSFQGQITSRNYLHLNACIWLHCATLWKVAGLIPGGVMDFSLI
jgi:hypothetical protein